MVDLQESTTAKLCSFARAFHSNVERNKIFDDYLAYDMMGKEQYEEIGQLIENRYNPDLFDPDRGFTKARICRELINFISPIPLSRIAFAEGELRTFTRMHTSSQYVICGAGMDTFSFRNDNPAIRIFELDHPDTQRYKLERIEDLEWNIPDNVHYVAVDFSSDGMESALSSSGFDPGLPTFFSILGVTYYLPLSVFEQMVRQIAGLTTVESKLAFDYPDETAFRKDSAPRIRYLAGITRKLGEPMMHGFSFQEMKKVLAGNGFSVEKHMAPEEIQNAYFTGRSDQQHAFENIHFMLAEKTPPARCDIRKKTVQPQTVKTLD